MDGTKIVSAMQFNSLFADADRYSGLSSRNQLRTLKVDDTSLFDEISDELREKSNINKEADPEIVNMRSIVKRVPREKHGTQLRVLEPNVKAVSIDDDCKKGLHRDDEEGDLMRMQTNHTQPYAVPEVDWEQAVGSIMYESDDSDSFGKEHVDNAGRAAVAPKPAKKCLVLRRSLPLSAAGLDKDAPFACFEVGSVSMADAQRAEEYIDEFIPNCVTEDELKSFEMDDNEEDDEETDDDSDDEDFAQEEGKTLTGGTNPVSDAKSATKKEGLGLSLNISRKHKIMSAKDIEKKRLQDEAKEEELLMQSMTKAERSAFYKQKKAERLARVSSDLIKNVGERGDDDSNGRNKLRGKNSVSHSRLALNHLNTRPDLSAIQLRFFHRPRLSKKNRKKNWRLSFYNQALANKNAIHQRKQQSANGKVDIVSSSGSNSIQSDNVNMCVTSGDFFLLEYAEENPPLRLNYGMVSKLVNYYRPPDNRNQADLDEEEGAKVARAKAAQAKRQESLSQCRVPRHVRLLLSHRDQKQNAYEYGANIPRLSIGETRLLSPTDDSPFLGQLKVEEIQQAIDNNLFRAPIWEHKPLKTDFLIICTQGASNAKGGDMVFVIREIPRTFVVGQTEPLQIVHRPTRHSMFPESNYVPLVTERFLRLCVSRIYWGISVLDDGFEFSKIEKSVFSDYTLDSTWSPQRHVMRQILQNTIMKELALPPTSKQHENKWKRRDFFKVEFDADGNDLEDSLSPEELAQKFSPEDVCAHESSASTEFRLREMGILESLNLHEIWSWLQLMGKLREHRETRAAYLQFLADDSRSQARGLGQNIAAMRGLGAAGTEQRMQEFAGRALKLEELSRIFISKSRTLGDKIDVGRFIFDRMLSAPWNTTAAYCYGHKEYDGLGRMELEGTGDPSGRGEGFAYVRIDNPTNEAAGKKSTKPDKIASSDRDLRKLTIDQMKQLCIAYGCKAEKLQHLRRWDLNEIVKTFNTIAVEKGVLKDDRFARQGSVVTGDRGKGSTYRLKCQDIWERQKMALRANLLEQNSDQATDNESDSDDDSDYSIDEDEDFVIANVREKAKKIAAKKRKELQERGLQGEHEEEKRQLQAFMRGISGPAGAANTNENAIGSSNMAVTGDGYSIPVMAAPVAPIMMVSGLEGSGASKAVMPSQRQEEMKPKQAVRKITRNIFEDGTEEIIIQFFVNDREIRALEQRNKTKGTMGLRRRGRGGSIAEYEDAEGDALGMAYDGEKAASVNPLALKVGKMKSTIKDSNEAISAAHERYQVKQSSSRGSGFPVYRLPHVAFAAMLETELVGLCSNKATPEFWMLWNPVPRNVPGYHDVIKNPISLSDIRENIASYKYLTYGLFLSDLDLMIFNANVFNGEKSPLAKKAADVKLRLVSNLELKRNTLGIDKCPIRNFEETIKKKFLYLGRPVPTFVPLPVPVPVSASGALMPSKYVNLGPALQPTGNLHGASSMASLATTGSGSDSRSALSPSSSSGGLADAIRMDRQQSFNPAGVTSPGPDLGLGPSLVPNFGSSSNLSAQFSPQHGESPALSYGANSPVMSPGPEYSPGPALHYAGGASPSPTADGPGMNRQLSFAPGEMNQYNRESGASPTSMSDTSGGGGEGGLPLYPEGEQEESDDDDWQVDSDEDDDDDGNDGQQSQFGGVDYPMGNNPDRPDSGENSPESQIGMNVDGDD